MREAESGPPTAVPGSAQDTGRLGSVGSLPSVRPDPATILPWALVNFQVPSGSAGKGEGCSLGLLISQQSGGHMGSSDESSWENVLGHRNAGLASWELIRKWVKRSRSGT